MMKSYFSVNSAKTLAHKFYVSPATVSMDVKLDTMVLQASPTTGGGQDTVTKEEGDDGTGPIGRPRNVFSFSDEDY